MEQLLLDIVHQLREDAGFDEGQLMRCINAHSNRLPGDRRFAKKHLMPYYLHTKENDPARWQRWGIDDATEKRLLSLIQMKPRRTASGVATITVITKPWTCRGTCVFCPNDVRMPKSYLHKEPACQRAERHWFDPYLQVRSRLNTLMQMGHATDKVELIVLGGTFGDYPRPYQLWFVHELFRALNDASEPTCGEHGPTDDETKAPVDAEGRPDADAEHAARHDTIAARGNRYEAAGIPRDESELEAACRTVQQRVSDGTLPFNAAIRRLYGPGTPWESVSRWQGATLEDVYAMHRRNETAAHRCVGLVVETRPDLVDAETLTFLRQLGCTKVQIGVQSQDAGILERSARAMSMERIRNAFCLLRLFGFKIHAHFMVNLPGATPERDKRDYRVFVHDRALQPDEVKLYPCALIASAPLHAWHEDGRWKPYDEETLVDVLAADVAATPPYTRISRMIRDFSAPDIEAGNKKTNLRQLVERKLEADGTEVHEMRYREIGVQGASTSMLSLEDIPYRTESTDEHFLQWVTPDGKIAGFLRLSIPHRDAVASLPGIPIGPDEAMIREVHVYGKVARLHQEGEGAQHLGLGKQLVARACCIAAEAGCSSINVISAVGTRGYYRALGFHDSGLYQAKELPYSEIR